MVPEPLSHINAITDPDVYIYHHSIYCESGVRKFKELGCKKVLKYHNITPPEFFPKNSEPAVQCQKGLDQLEEILAQDCAVWADSEYNAEQLLRVKPVNYTVIPPFNQVPMLQEAVPDYRGVLKFNDWNTTVIMVGRVAPNKDVLQGVDAFNEFQKKNGQSRLIIVGDNSGDYAKEVDGRIRLYGLQDKVFITGKVSLPTLKAYYLIADLLLIASKHEGFCVPMVEAMAMNVPVVSNTFCALPWTGGDAVKYTNANPGDMAAGMSEVLADRIKWIEAGRQRFDRHYSMSAIEGAVTFGLNSIEQK